MSHAHTTHFSDCGCFADKLQKQIDALKAAVETARIALEHCRNRPHEHNPPDSFTITRCEVIDRALAALTPSPNAGEK